MLCGDIEPNPGPFRGQLDLTVGFVAATSQRMARCLEGFKIWVRDVAEVDWLPLTEDPQALDWVVLLRAWPSSLSFCVCHYCYAGPFSFVEIFHVGSLAD